MAQERTDQGLGGRRRNTASVPDLVSRAREGDARAVARLISLVEEDGFFVTGHAAAISTRAVLRGLRSAIEGIPLFMTLNGGFSGGMQQ